MDVFEFYWLVPQGGYHWHQAQIYHQPGPKPAAMTQASRLDKDVHWVLTEDITLGQEFRRKRYAPLQEYPALFRALAQLATDDRQAILSFANRYGGLGVERPCHILGRPQTPFPPRGETHQQWMESIEALRRAVTIWELFKAGDQPALARYIRWRQQQYAADGVTVTHAGGWVYDSHPDLPPGEAPPPPGRTQELIMPPVPELFQAGEAALPALFLVQRWINKHLEGQVAPRLLYQLDTGHQVLQMVPSTLLSAAWLQLAQAIAGNHTYRACKECGEWFEISARADGRTARRLFCSDACKSRDYRRHREAALRSKSQRKKAAGAAQIGRQRAANTKRHRTKRK
jgi:hypothetical protein